MLPMMDDHPRPTNSSREVSRQQPSWTDGFQGPREDEISRTLNLREAGREFGLTPHQVYRAVRYKQLRAIQPGGKGRIYYLEEELRALAAALRRGKANEDWAA